MPILPSVVKWSIAGYAIRNTVASIAIISGNIAPVVEHTPVLISLAIAHLRPANIAE